MRHTVDSVCKLDQSRRSPTGMSISKQVLTNIHTTRFRTVGVLNPPQRFPAVKGGLLGFHNTIKHQVVEGFGMSMAQTSIPQIPYFVGGLLHEPYTKFIQIPT